MKCLACGNEYDEKVLGACPRCGFPAILMTDESPEMRETLRQTVAAFRKDLLGEFKVYVKAYVFEKTSRTFTEKGEQRLLIAASDQLIPQPNTILWSEITFGASDELVLEAELEKGGETRPYTFEMTPPSQPEPWQVGAVLNDSLQLFLVVGSPENNSLSGPMELL